MNYNIIRSLENNEYIIEYKNLQKSLLNNEEVISLVNRLAALNAKLKDLDKYSSEYSNIYNEYNDVSSLLFSNAEYARFKELEREINLLVMTFNKKLEKLFNVTKKGCNH